MEILHQGDARLRDLRDGYQAMGLGIGNVYHVMKTSETYFKQFEEDMQGEHTDGSLIVHADAGTGDGIQSALDACVANRNDYVIVYPSQSDYDLTVALTLSKKAVHLICPAGMNSYGIGANNAVRLEQTGSVPIMEVSDSAIEIAGFYLKNKATKGGIIISNTSYGLNIHNNYWAMNLSGATNEPMLGPLISNTTGDAGAWSTYERNFFQSQAGANATIAAIIRFNSQATGVRICNNELAIGDTNNTATVGIQNHSVKGIVRDNIFHQHVTGSGAGLFTHCVQIHASGTAYNNLGNVADGKLVVGGTNVFSFIKNFNSSGTGGAQDDES